MGRTLSIAVVAVAVLFLSEPAGSVEDLRGQPAPNFTLKSVQGKKVSLDDFKGSVVLLDFWAVWCGPCKESLPFLENLAAKYRSKGFAVVGLHVDDRMPPLDEVRQFLKKKKVRYTNLVSTFEVDEAFQVYSMPTSFVIDREGKFHSSHVGFNPATAPEKIEAHIRDALGIE